jgi:uncharacterized coiled-coil protein SlyX
MTQANRGPITLTTAAILLALAVAAYLLGDMQSNVRRREEAQFGRELQRDARASLREIHEELTSQRTAIYDSRRRLDELTKRLRATQDDLQELKRSHAVANN